MLAQGRGRGVDDGASPVTGLRVASDEAEVRRPGASSGTATVVPSCRTRRATPKRGSCRAQGATVGASLAVCDLPPAPQAGWRFP